MLSGGTQRRALCQPEWGNQINLNIIISRAEIKLTIISFTVQQLGVIDNEIKKTVHKKHLHIFIKL